MSILGFELNHTERSIGFNFYWDKNWDKDTKMFVFYFYDYIKRIKIKDIFKSHYVCNYCQTPVSPNDLWCKNCDIELDEDEFTFIVK